MHLKQWNLEGSASAFSIPAHLVWCHTPHKSQANILSPSSSFVPHLQSTSQFSTPLSMRYWRSPSLDEHLPLTRMTPFVPIKNFRVRYSSLQWKHQQFRWWGWAFIGLIGKLDMAPKVDCKGINRAGRIIFYEMLTVKYLCGCINHFITSSLRPELDHGLWVQ